MSPSGDLWQISQNFRFKLITVYSLSFWDIHESIAGKSNTFLHPDCGYRYRIALGRYNYTVIQRFSSVQVCSVFFQLNREHQMIGSNTPIPKFQDLLNRKQLITHQLSCGGEREKIESSDKETTSKSQRRLNDRKLIECFYTMVYSIIKFYSLEVSYLIFLKLIHQPHYDYSVNSNYENSTILKNFDSFGVFLFYFVSYVRFCDNVTRETFVRVQLEIANVTVGFSITVGFFIHEDDDLWFLSYVFLI